MNREQIICILVGIFILAGMFLCVPVSFYLNSLYYYMGDPNAGSNLMTFYEFMPEGWPRVINYGVLFWQCFFLAAIISCSLFAFRKDIRKPIHNIKTYEKIVLCILISVSILFFLLWFTETSFDNLFWYFKLGLMPTGLLGLSVALIIADVYVDKKPNTRLLQAILLSCTILALCMIFSNFRHRYVQPNEFQITPTMWRLLGGLTFLGIWVCYIIDQCIRKIKQGGGNGK